MKTILLVEDDPFIRDIYTSYLKKEGFNVDIATSPTMALEKIKNNYPDLLVLDLNLDPGVPGPKDGLDILQTVKHDPTTKNLKIIVMSNYNQKDYPELSGLFELGVSKYFLKVESTPDQIANAIKEILK